MVPRRQLLECALLKAVAAHYVMTREGAAAQQARERELITELALAIERGAPSTLDPVFRPPGTAPPATRNAAASSSTSSPRSPTPPLWSGIDGWC